MDIEVLEKLFKYAAHLQHIYGTFTAHLQHIYSTLQHNYSTCTVWFCKCVVAAHVLLSTVDVPLLHMYCWSPYSVIFIYSCEYRFLDMRHGLGLDFRLALRRRLFCFL